MITISIGVGEFFYPPSYPKSLEFRRISSNQSSFHHLRMPLYTSFGVLYMIAGIYFQNCWFLTAEKCWFYSTAYTSPRSRHNHTTFHGKYQSPLRQLEKIGFTDTFRHMHPETEGAYTHYWLNDTDGTRGHRLDYFFVSSDLKNKIINADIHKNIKGSDHLPVTLELDMKTVKKRMMKIHHLTYEDLLERERQGIYFKDLVLVCKKA